MISIQKYFFKRFLFAAIVGYFFILFIAVNNSLEQAEFFFKSNQGVLIGELEKNKDKLILFITLKDLESYEKVFDQIIKSTDGFEFCKEQTSSKCLGFENEYDLTVGNSKVFYKKKSGVFLKIILHNIFSFTNILYFFILTALGFLAKQVIEKKVILPILELNEYLENFEKEKNQVLENLEIEEWSNVNNALLSLRARLRKLENEIVDTTISNVAQQVSHDIRSPLAALNAIFGHLNGINEEKRILVRNAINRINDIANLLLLKSKEQKNKESYQSESIELISALIDSLVSEKRMQFRNKMNVYISEDYRDGADLFAKINPIEFKSVISNLINNAVESLPNEIGTVDIKLSLEDSSIVLKIKDSGKGIPESLLNQLGAKGISHGKDGLESGSELGVYNAFSVIKKIGGTITYESKIDSGTVVTIKLPRCDAPEWFQSELVIQSNSTIVTLDDDISIQSIWSGRLESLKSKDFGILHLKFSSSHDFIQWYKTNNGENHLYLIDYELLNDPKNGLDVIEELGIAKKAILVTSRYEEHKIRMRCIYLGMKILPKYIVSNAKISIR